MVVCAVQPVQRTQGISMYVSTNHYIIVYYGCMYVCMYVDGYMAYDDIYTGLSGGHEGMIGMWDVFSPLLY
jgi:hypothetical protein